eukprot:4065513-Pleurochrysis_carterae.AAC.1
MEKAFRVTALCTQHCWPCNRCACRDYAASEALIKPGAPLARLKARPRPSPMRVCMFAKALPFCGAAGWPCLRGPVRMPNHVRSPGGLGRLI